MKAKNDEIRFFWNGLKASDGKLQKCSYSDGILLNHPSGTLTIYARGDTTRFSAEVRKVFTVENDSDSMTDYFESDRIRVLPSHPFYAQVMDALKARRAHYTR